MQTASSTPISLTGPSAERTALVTANIPDLTTYYENDTGNVFRFDSLAWRQISSVFGVVSQLGAGTAVIGNIADSRAANLHVNATAAVNTGSTATLPAAGAGLFHYITRIELVKLYSVIGVANGAGVIVTSTNLPGARAWTTEQAAGAVGTAPRVIDVPYARPFRSSVANTDTTFVAPAQLQTIWRWSISYFTAA